MIWMIISGLIVGILLGFVMQRTRFCLTGGFRDMYVQKNNKMFYALLIAISIQSIGLFTLVGLGLFKLEAATFPLVGTIIGSFVFGIGIILAGGCATGTWYRAAEGLIGSWIALVLYGVTAAIMKSGPLNPLQENINSYKVVNSNVAETLNMPVWILIVLLVGITAYFVTKTLKKPKVAIPQLKQKYTGIRHILFEKRYHPFAAAIAVGLIALIAWPMSASTGRIGGLGITTPSANIVQFLVTGDMSLINWGVFLVLGIFVGSYIAAKGSREFKWRMPDTKTIRNSVIGGACMGVGASLAGGCSIGNGLVSTAAMSWQGWVALPSMIVGAWFMSYFIFVKPRKANQTKTQVSTQSI